MISKINKEIDEFTSNIKTLDGHDEMLRYMNSSYVSSIKLLMFASSTFSIYGRVMLFFFIALIALLISSSVGIMPLNSTFLSLTVFILFVFILFYITHFKKVFAISVEKSKSSMKSDN